MRTDLSFQKLCAIEELPQKEHWTVGIHGTLGSFNDEAWNKFAQEMGLATDAYTIKELVESYKVLEAVSKQEIDIGIFAFANSGAGGVAAAIEAMGQFNFRVLTVFTMPISMCLLAHPEIKDIEEIKVFYGHPVALKQCSKTLSSFWPDIPTIAASDALDTALSAKMLAHGEIPKTHAIFASKRAASLYGLTILKEGVHHDPNNATAFAVVTHR